MFEGFVNYIEKRIFRRVDAELPVDLELGSETVQTTSSNISCGGMFLLVDPDKLGDQHKLDVVIHLPNRKNPVKMSAEILRSESVDDRRGVAVQFQGLYNDSMLEIEKFVKGKLN
ncbi:PilZ domain-containing protein [Deltaproteobacteria bacterium PRO3]|nr:PilZ domain-containing protein [Deltaproteobacteria bacterium PRO3]